MVLDWILSPLALAVLLGVTVLAGGVLFFTLKKAIAESEARQRAECRVLEEAASQMRASLEQLRTAVQESNRQVAAARPAAGINLSKRGQALRMHRRGDPPERIATALDLPRNEVELLLKVHRKATGQS